MVSLPCWQRQQADASFQVPAPYKAQLIMLRLGTPVQVPGGTTREAVGDSLGGDPEVSLPTSSGKQGGRGLKNSEG
ncbi:hypothetical protein ATANTOWER_004404 [Ataeniobius toweri]|uniref:Uncharacterized protein n=1 Tax=Ataeniobius toweri TaxID=208326 RepID=A0ABU7BR74_9TELE|nr:hypothetical protein [Ataeniobius toweri]